MMPHPLTEPSDRAVHTQCAHDQLAHQIKAMRGDADALEDIQNYMRGIQQ